MGDHETKKLHLKKNQQYFYGKSRDYGWIGRIGLFFIFSSRELAKMLGT